LRRVSGLAVTGVEREESVVALAQGKPRPMGRNASSSKPTFACRAELEARFRPGLANPPFHGEGQSSPDERRAAALMDDGSLRDWLSLACKRSVSAAFSPPSWRATA